MALTPPAFQDNFYFSNGDLFVEASGANRHRRATTSELQELFHPRQNTTMPVRDPPAHWYEAQLIHYGLPPSKVKGTALKRLLDAVNSGRLVVPQAILNLESVLKEKWDANERKARKEAADQPSKPQTGTRKAKRKAEEGQNSPSIGVNGMNFNFNLNLGSMGTYTTESAVGSPPDAKRVKKEPQTPPSKDLAPSSQAGTPLFFERERAPYGPPLRPEQEQKPQRPTETKPKVNREMPTPSLPPRINPPPPLPYYDPPSPLPPSLGLINGTYAISCPYVTTQWNCHDLSLTVCYDTEEVWCAYDFEAFSGIFRVDRRPFRASAADQIPVRWRGREHGEGEMSTGNHNHGWISFLGNGRIQGCLEVTGDFECQGYKVQRRGLARSARSMREEWDSYPISCRKWCSITGLPDWLEINSGAE